MSAGPVFELPAFRAEALCAQVDPEAWFPETGGSSLPAKRICNGHDGRPPCPVKAECLRWALERDERYGVWGGLGDRERRAIRSRRGQAAA